MGVGTTLRSVLVSGVKDRRDERLVYQSCGGRICPHQLKLGTTGDEPDIDAEDEDKSSLNDSQQRFDNTGWNCQ
ncbi:hypothetical protein SCP_1800230 [Sparassis crispa]|uniref:Uncharacterized protein n=1 Tax=Sparassis crispa TaxID=139825 RepID=A0A401H6J2_9APHY|nr:hypothetical protein SCP_1800230 [Sparassis crispa]GBE90001.1 hypothetical protein SCP_1800230 [Sparassis crispa]